MRGQGLDIGPEGVREFIGSIVEAIPDLRVEILETTSQDDRCAIQWRFSGTFAGPGALSGVAPTGHRIVLEGVDVLCVRDGLIQSNDAFTDTMAVRPPDRHDAAAGLTHGAADDGAPSTPRPASPPASRRAEAKLVAEGVWVCRASRAAATCI